MTQGLLFAGLKHQGRYQVIAADPPWPYENWSHDRMKDHGSVAAHYQTLTMEQLLALPIGELADPNGCALALWSTAPRSAEGDHARLIRAWGFRPVTKLFHWRKVYRKCRCGHAEDRHLRCRDPKGNVTVVCQVKRCHCTRYDRRPYCGLGFYTRSSGEDCWLGTIGKGLMPADKGVRQEIEAPVEEHSEKPEAFYDRVEALWPKARHRLELFARGKPRKGWTTWGNEAEGGDPTVLTLEAR